MRVPLLDIVPRIKQIVEHPIQVNRSIIFSVCSGLVEGLALFLLLPAATALVSHQAVWGLTIGGWLWVFAGLAAIAAVVNYFEMHRWYAAGMDFMVNVHRKIGDQVAKLPLGWFRGNTSGTLSRLVSSNLMATGEIIAHMLSPLVSKTTASLVILVCSWLWDWRLGVALLAAAPVFAGLVLCATVFMKRAHHIGETPDIELSSRIIEFALCQGTLRATGRSEVFAPLTDAAQTNYRTKRRQLWLETIGLSLSGAMTQVVVVVMIAVAAALAISGALAPIPAIAFIGLALRFTTLLSEIAESAMGLESRRPLLDTFDEVLTAQPLPEPGTSAQLSTPATVEFENVSFGYSDQRPVLHNISFSAPAKSMTALVGPSGSGKTTIMRLISRFYDANSGVVKVGGVGVRQLTTSGLMKQLSIVFQDVYLFDDTLAANIRVGNPDATNDEVVRAARIAGVSEIAERLPKGLASSVGEGGRALSGGERQRVSIARALLKKAPIVLFDEATSALDPENEAHIIEAMNELRKISTVIVIAHKLDTIKNADAIVALTADGAVDAVGTHSQLLKRSAMYRHFWQTREKAQGWQLNKEAQIES